MTAAFRTRTDDELFDDAPPSGLRPLEDVVFPDADYNAIAKELGAARAEVSYVIHAGHRREGNRTVDFYVLTGSHGPGEGYDASQDSRAAFQATQDVLRAGVAAIGTAAASAKK